jgi:aspartyl-tRNA(Asn)/glutamyl-tRNA(Gln) amidotransferase subunit C
MELSEAEVRHVAALARLDLSDKEVESLAKDMNQILGYVAKLNELNTDDVEPTTHVVEMSTPYRDDEVSRTPSVEDALANAPKTENNHFVVPSIIE